MNALALAACILAAIPALMFVLNRRVYRPPARVGSGDGFQGPSLSVLIPARNEERCIRATVESVLANREADFEVIVMDDHSTDATARIVTELAAGDSRLRLVTAPPLPPGWCGKQHACYSLSQLARHPLLVFLDADVRLEPDALARLGRFMVESKADLGSGVPGQRLVTFSEKLLIPLIHFVLLGYLPMHWMRGSKSPAFAAGCGQLFVADAGAYRESGGHAMIRASLHDGLKLPRIFRVAGFRTDLLDATDLAVCRMYQTNGEVWRGLAKNATEGLAAPARIVPMTVLLLGAAVLPFVLLLTWPWLGVEARVLSVVAALLAWLPRWLSVFWFNQPPGSALLHPVGVLALMGIQWFALGRSWIGRPAVWKGRSYDPGGGSSEAGTGTASEIS